MLHLGKKLSNWVFQGLFWLSMTAGLFLILDVVVAVVALGVPMMFREEDAHPPETDLGVMLATGALALFTAFLWFSAAITALCPYRDTDIDRRQQRQLDASAAPS